MTPAAARPRRSMFRAPRNSIAYRRWRARCGLLLVLPLLLAADTDAWRAAINTGDTKALSELAVSAVDVDTPGRRGKTALMLAASRGDEPLVRRLLEQGATVDQRNEAGGTALMYAAQYGEIAIAGLLLANGADVNAFVGKYGGALMIAALKGHAAMASLLIEQGADVNARDALLGTPVMRAAERRRTEVVKLLLAAPTIDVNATDQDGRTALHYTAIAGSREIAELLLAQGTRPDIRDKEGSTAAEVAEGNGYSELADYLREE